MNDQTLEQPINEAMITMLQACGFAVSLDPLGDYCVKGGIESAAAFYKLTIAGAEASLTAASATDHVLAISAREKLRRAHDALAGIADTDLDHFEDEEEEIEAVPAQYAARTIFAAIDDIDALLASPRNAASGHSL